MFRIQKSILVVLSAVMGLMAQAQLNRNHVEFIREQGRNTPPAVWMKSIDEGIKKRLEVPTQTSLSEEVLALLTYRTSACTRAPEACVDFSAWSQAVCREKFEPSQVSGVIQTLALNAGTAELGAKLLAQARSCSAKLTPPQMEIAFNLYRRFVSMKWEPLVQETLVWMKSWENQAHSKAAIEQIQSFLESNSGKRPFDIRVAGTLALVATSWIGKDHELSITDGRWFNVSALTILTGHGSSLVPMLRKTPPAALAKKSIDSALGATHLLCWAEAVSGKTRYCGTDLEQIKSYTATESQRAQWNSIKSIYELITGGNASAEAIQKLRGEVKDTASPFIPWMDLFYAQALLRTGNTAGARTSLEAFTKNSARLVRQPWDKYQSPYVETMILRTEGKYTEARALAQKSLLALESEVLGTTEMNLRLGLEVLTASVLLKDKESTDAMYLKLKKVVPAIPDMNHFLILADALHSAAHGRPPTEALSKAKALVDNENPDLFKVNKALTLRR